MKHINKYIIIKILFFLSLVTLSCLFLSNNNLLYIAKESILNKYSNNNVIFSKKKLFNSISYIVDYEDINNTNDVKVVKSIEKKDVINDKPIVYIYNTHQGEKYFLPFINDYSVVPTVEIASSMLKEHLEDNGINTYVEKRSIKDYLNKHNLDYTGSYEASRYYLKDVNKNNNFKVFIDLHRDSVKRKSTLYTKNGINYAKVMFVVTTKHKNYQKNMNFVLKLNNLLNSQYKGISRGIYKRNDVIFNQDISDKAILIELGGVDNTIDEINNTLKVFASMLSEIINEGK